MKIYPRPNYDPQELAARNNAALAREADRLREERLAAALRERIKGLEAALIEIADSRFPMGATAKQGFEIWRKLARTAREALKGAK